MRKSFFLLMNSKTGALILLYFLATSFFPTSGTGQSSFDHFKKSQVEGGKSSQDFVQFKKELEKEYQEWVKYEEQWDKITLDTEPAEKKPQEKRGTQLPLDAKKAGRDDAPVLVPLPRKSFKISSKFGYRIHPIHKRRVFHGGIDYAAKRGTRIFAPADGKILKAGVAGGYGNYVMIKHAFEYKTAYAHLDRVVVEKNQPVKQGELVGYVGNSGSSTGPHLHYEVIRRNKKIDPERVQQN